MKTFLNLFRQLNEIKFLNSRFVFEHNTIVFDSSNFYIFVFFSLIIFVIVSELD